MMSNANRYRIFIIGAGFSVHAGLPLGDKLFSLVRARVRERSGKDNKLEADLDWYFKYRERCQGVTQNEPVDYEKFMSYLDMEHFLGLRGSDTWSEEGNESQLLIRNGIMEVIFDRMPECATDEVKRFCERLSPTDTILTFNYDTLVEDALDELGKPYRLFPNRLKSVDPMSSVIDNDAEDGEIVVHKLHGSIDWFSKLPYIKDRKLSATYSPPWKSRHPIFKDGSLIKHSPIVEGLCAPDDPLQYIHRVHDLNEVIGSGFWACSPFILAPSSSKILYANPVKGLWRGLQKVGGFNLGLGVVGYSLPQYDEYARQALYHLMRNYTECEPNFQLDGQKKGPVRILDFCADGESDWKIRRNYSFMNWNRCEVNTRGVSIDGIDWLMK